ncbi:oxidoreductase- short-chain dehydrogenase/reductase family [Apiospora aurea]|uniref:Oxidoreductase- short-chain dehydrogenase/reductase family n=1 Tax=Apiospora aurea TaxID=335848 RepID=A0ABR1QA81_9PEZI
MSNIKFDKSTIPDLSGRVVLITGGTNGIGAEIAVELAKKNPARLLFTGRSAASAEKTLERVRQSAPAALSPDGYEIHFATNHLAAPPTGADRRPASARRQQPPRIIYTTSLAWMGGSLDFAGGLRTTQESVLFGRWVRYCNSKLANLLYAREPARRHPKLLCFSAHPGVVTTGLVTDLKLTDRLFVQATNVGKIITPEQGTFNHLWAVSAPRESIEQGGFYEPVGVLSLEKGVKAKDTKYASQLWDYTEKELEKFM